MKIHKVHISGSNETLCGMTFPKNTTTVNRLVTCKECKNSPNNKHLLGEVCDVEGLKEALAHWDGYDFTQKIKVWLLPLDKEPYNIIALEPRLYGIAKLRPTKKV